MSHALSESQSASLFDILTHYDTYAEIRDFRLPGSLKHYGPPFTHESKRPSTAPALQTLVSRFLLTLPGLKDLPEGFWQVQCHDLIDSLEKAELSESYDKGVIGSRKTLATAISALIEYPVRGTYGGFPQVKNPHHEYDLSNAEDLSRSFRDFLDQIIYGTVLEETIEKAAETDQLEDHGQLMKAVHEYVLVNLASFMHYILILSPKGQYLLKLIESVHKLVPYVVVRQTLKIGNVATMINAMVKVGLAKMSVASITNWMGLTQTEDEGMNLMQQIISTVLGWDTKELESRATKIEKEKTGPTKEQLKALKDYENKSMQEHEKIREQSQRNSISMVIAVLKAASVSTALSETQHKQALDYLSIQLSIRDRKEIVQILCHSQPDHLTTSVRAIVSAYEPVIRQLHMAIDLSETVYDLEAFVRDMIKLAKLQPPGKDGKTSIPTVGDFVQLLKKHQYSCHKFIHQFCKNGKEVTSWYLEWAKKAASHFHRAEDSKNSIPITHGAAGDLTGTLNELFISLDEPTQKAILPILDAQTKYLEQMHTSSVARFASVLNSPPSKNPQIVKLLSSAGSRPSSQPPSRPSTPSLEKKHFIDPSTTKPTQATDPDKAPPEIESDPGPGAYLARWQDLLENTPITPLTAKGDAKSASSKSVVQASARDVDGSVLADFEASGPGTVQEAAGSGKKIERPDVRVVVEALAGRFRDVLAEKNLYW